MPDQIILEGTVARHVRTEILGETLISNLVPHLTTRVPIVFPVLPQNAVRYLHFDPEQSRGVLLVETRPQRHIIQVRHHNNEYPDDAARRDPDGISRFNVQLPYQYFAYSFTVHETPGALRDFTVDRSLLYWRKDPLRQPDDRLTIAACPNVDTAGVICWGQTQSDATSLSARIDDLTNNFFTTIFNQDLGHRSPFGHSMIQWERNSEDPLAYRTWPFWTNAPDVPLSDVSRHIRSAEPPIRAELDPSYVEIPELPENFTLARAREWLNTLNDGARRRLTLAVATTTDPAPTEIEA